MCATQFLPSACFKQTGPVCVVVQVCAVILDPTLKRDLLAARSAEERSRAAFLNVLGLVDSLPHRIGLMMEDWYRVSHVECPTK